MAENWQDLVPFYVAGLMSPADRAAFEAFLAQSPEAQQAVEEWRTIANEVYREADSRANSLPPLPQQTRAQLSVQPRVPTNGHNQHADLSQTMPVYKPTRAAYQAPRPQVQPAQPILYPQKAPRPAQQPYTAWIVSAAAVVFVLFCVVLIAIYALSQDDDPKSASIDEATPEGTTSITPTLTTVPNMSECNLFSLEGEPVKVYTEPDENSAVITEYEGSAIAHNRAENGWYAIGDGQAGYVNPDDVNAVGTCDQLPFPIIPTTINQQQGTSSLPPTTTPVRNTPTTSGVQPTPTAAFGQYTGLGGYPLLTLVQVGEIPAGTRVNGTYTYFDGTEIVYGISDDSGRSADARQSQLGLVPDVTPGAIPTAAYQIYIGMGGYPLETTEQVGNIPAGTRVRISHGQTNYDGWVYYIKPENEIDLEAARENQLRVVVDYSNGTPTSTPLPTPITGTDGAVIEETMLVTVEEVIDTGLPIKSLIVSNTSRATDFQVDVYTTSQVPPITNIAFADARVAQFSDLKVGMLLRVTGVGLDSIRAYSIIILE